jgi:hypothetical protein
MIVLMKLTLYTSQNQKCQSRGSIYLSPLYSFKDAWDLEKWGIKKL